MLDIEWLEFMNEINAKEKTNIKKECKKRKVGEQTLRTKATKFVNSEDENFQKVGKMFLKLHPYTPRDVIGIDFEHIMRDSIIHSISQKQISEIYGISHRTIQRKFAKIKKENPRLYEIYNYYKALKAGERLAPEIIDEISKEYERQKPLDAKEVLKKRREQFFDRMKQLDKQENSRTKTNTLNYYRKSIENLDTQIEEYKGEEK